MAPACRACRCGTTPWRWWPGSRRAPSPTASSATRCATSARASSSPRSPCSPCWSSCRCYCAGAGSRARGDAAVRRGFASCRGAPWRAQYLPVTIRVPRAATARPRAAPTRPSAASTRSPVTVFRYVDGDHLAVAEAAAEPAHDACGEVLLLEELVHPRALDGVVDRRRSSAPRALADLDGDGRRLEQVLVPVGLAILAGLHVEPIADHEPHRHRARLAALAPDGGELERRRVSHGRRVSGRRGRRQHA